MKIISLSLIGNFLTHYDTIIYWSFSYTLQINWKMSYLQMSLLACVKSIIMPFSIEDKHAIKSNLWPSNSSDQWTTKSGACCKNRCTRQKWRMLWWQQAMRVHCVEMGCNRSIYCRQSYRRVVRETSISCGCRRTVWTHNVYISHSWRFITSYYWSVHSLTGRGIEWNVCYVYNV